MRWKQFLIPVRSMDTEEARAYIGEHKEGTFTLVDVRQPGEYKKVRIAGAKLIPIAELSDRLGELDPEKPTIVYCAVGGRSRVATQLLAGQGFKQVYNLKGGITGWQGHTAVGPAEVGMAVLRGDEAPAEIIVVAYGMEEGLRGFYTAMASRVNDQEVSGMFAKLADIEVRHKEELFNLYKRRDPSAHDLEAFEAKVVSKFMEGGLTTEEFLEKNKPAMETVLDVLNMAMMIETQALDLYLRFSDKSKEDKTKSVLFDIAEEEKAHLAALGRLIDRKV
jgi:rhodanese-related sulfurtransferase/rubrerythrin